jgi:hypothetical protein
VFYSFLEYSMKNKVQKSNNSKCYTPSLEPSRIYFCIMLYAGNVDRSRNLPTTYAVNVNFGRACNKHLCFCKPRDISRASVKHILALAIRTGFFGRFLVKLEAHNTPSSGPSAWGDCKTLPPCAYLRHYIGICLEG